MFAYGDGCVPFTHIYVLHNTLIHKFNLLAIKRADLNISALPPDNQTGSRWQRPASQSTLIAFNCSTCKAVVLSQSRERKDKIPPFGSWISTHILGQQLSSCLLHIFRGFEGFPSDTFHALYAFFLQMMANFNSPVHPTRNALDFNKYSFWTWI